MELAFILSAIFLQLPMCIYKDTLRRYQRMALYNPEKAYDYEFENGKIDNLSIYLVVFLFVGYILSYIPLLNINVHWFVALIIHLVFIFVVSPIITFIIYPKGKIYNRKSIHIFGVVCIIIGIILFLTGIDNLN